MNSLLPQELLDYSKEHLSYEIEMFFEIANNFKNLLEKHEGAPNKWVVRSAFTESFALHLRCLLLFLYPSQNSISKQTDVLAIHYLLDVSDHEKWKREKIPPNMKVALDRANKEVAHLTTERIAGFSPKKVWDFGVLSEELKTILLTFCSDADSTKLHEEILQLIRKL